MFLLSIIEDKLKTAPEQFDRNANDVLIEQIELKYANKVLLNVGLCICFFDFVEIGDPYLYPGEGCSIQQVKFRLVVFRPFVGEILTGKIASSNKDGVKLSLEFFDDVLVPSSLLQTPSSFNPSTGLWTWKYGEDQESEFVMDVGEEVRFRVRTIHFTGLTMTAKGVTATTTSESQEVPTIKNEKKLGTKQDENNVPITTVRRRSSSIGLSNDDEVPAAMEVVGCMNDFGLGLISWW